MNPNAVSYTHLDVYKRQLDDLSMAHAAVNALLESEEGMKMTKVMAIFDNEETGSGTKQGAASPVLMNLLKRINSQLGGDEEDYSVSYTHLFDGSSFD